MPGPAAATPATIRLDKWLWHARFAKTRSRAAAMVEAGAIRVNALRVVKPATAVRVGDGLSFALGSRVVALRIRDLGQRRGPAPEARALYDDLGAPADAGPEAPAALGAPSVAPPVREP